VLRSVNASADGDLVSPRNVTGTGGVAAGNVEHREGRYGPPPPTIKRKVSSLTGGGGSHVLQGPIVPGKLGPSISPIS